MYYRKLIILIAVSFLLQSCSGTNKQGVGTVIGGVTGALVGSRFGKGGGALLATGIGAVGGAMIGSHIGKTMDDNDRRLMELRSQQALETLPSGTTTEWRNPDNGHYGYVTPKAVTRTETGEYCREYTQTIHIGGKEEKAYGRACRKPDGHWQMVESR